MPKPTPASADFSDDLVPEIAPAPVVTRVFKPLGWYRPRKQYIRKYQWNHEIVQQIVSKRSGVDTSLLRVFGLPSSEYLDLLSMRAVCEKHGQQVQYLGFNASYSPPKTTTGTKTKKHFKEAVVTDHFKCHHQRSLQMPPLGGVIYLTLERRSRALTRNKLRRRTPPGVCLLSC